ncbi:MAG TPA: hypothetical protein VJM75_13870 [Acidimicrobiales bacterium]|nr:hypothetical protein [Acidimicrobiales bacterium]
MALRIAVPLWQLKWHGAPVDQLLARAKVCGDVVAAHGDCILYRTKGTKTRKGAEGAEGAVIPATPGTAEAFNHLAEGVALASMVAVGGMDLFGIHFHDGCGARSPADCIDLKASA